MRQLALVALTAISAACGLRAPISHSVTIAPSSDGQTARVTVRTDLTAEAANRAVALRQDALRQAILNGLDDWSVRLHAARPDTEHIVFEKSKGVLQSAEHSVIIGLDDLQRIFADTGLTVHTTRGDGWSELAIYPGSSSRASREQRDHVERSLTRWSADAAEYLRAVDRLYSYLRSEPHRAEAVFTILFAAGEERSVIEEEEALLRDVTESMATMLDRIDEAERDALPLDEEFDLVYNPFPAEMLVRPPRAAIAVDGFERRGEDFVIRRTGLLDAVADLEGRWISPDPLAILIRADAEKRDLPTPKELAALPRQSSSVVTPRQIQEALLELVQPVATYRLRWND